MEENEGREVTIGDYSVNVGDGVLTAHGIGSCVAVSIYDKEKRVGGMLHALLPKQDPKVVRSAKYVDTGLELLWKEARQMGGKNFVGKIAGGATMFGSDTGEKNVMSAEKKLEEIGIKIEGKDAGGERGRNCFFYLKNGKMKVVQSVRVNFSVKWLERVI
jgi:chemotaxis protein CheD